MRTGRLRKFIVVMVDLAESSFPGSNTARLYLGVVSPDTAVGSGGSTREVHKAAQVGSDI